jgi:hypothetical protein
MVFLMETKLKAPRIEAIKSRVGYGSVFVVDSVGRSGGLALFWSNDFMVNIQNYSRYHINAVVTMGVEKISWKFTGFYGHPEAVRRKESWSLLRHLSSFQPKPWLCCGDFNEIVEDSEKFGRCLKTKRHMEDFQLALADCRLMDLGFFGPRFTWCNKRERDHFVKERLDRATANIEWQNQFAKQKVEVLAASCSDHAPLFIVGTNSEKHARRPRGRFRYEAAWSNHMGHKQIIKKVWKEKPLSRNAWQVLLGKLEESKNKIRVWRKNTISSSEDVLHRKTEQLLDMQGGDGMLNMDAITELQGEIDEILEQDELKWRQRAKEDWLKHGDKNTKYFHACANQRSKVNKISMIEDDDGRRCTTQEEIEEAFISYFRNIFKSSSPSGIAECLDPVSMKVTQEMNSRLSKEVTSEEVKAAIFQMAPVKSPGPDGFSAIFFKKIGILLVRRYVWQ